MAGLHGLQSAGTIHASGCRDSRILGSLCAPPHVLLPWPEPPSAMGTTSRSPLLVRILGSACHPPYLGMSPRPRDGRATGRVRSPHGHRDRRLSP